jgi:hypothetical protein
LFDVETWACLLDPKAGSRPLLQRMNDFPLRLLLIDNDAVLDTEVLARPRVEALRQCGRASSFGHCVHFCIGAQLARVEVKLALEGEARAGSESQPGKEVHQAAGRHRLEQVACHAGPGRIAASVRSVAGLCQGKAP